MMLLVLELIARRHALANGTLTDETVMLPFARALPAEAEASEQQQQQEENARQLSSGSLASATAAEPGTGTQSTVTSENGNSSESPDAPVEALAARTSAVDVCAEDHQPRSSNDTPPPPPSSATSSRTAQHTLTKKKGPPSKAQLKKEKRDEEDRRLRMQEWSETVGAVAAAAGGNDGDACEDDQQNAYREEDSTVGDVHKPTLADFDCLCSHAALYTKDVRTSWHKALKSVSRAIQTVAAQRAATQKTTPTTAAPTTTSTTTASPAITAPATTPAPAPNTAPPIPTEDELLELISRVESNSFAFFSSSSRTLIIGRWIAPGASYFNHSCEPNLDTWGGDAVVGSFVANCAIPAGTPCTIHYIDINQPCSSRRRLLSDQYHFACECTRCVREAASPAKAQPTCTYEKSAGNPDVQRRERQRREAKRLGKKQAAGSAATSAAGAAAAAAVS